MIKSYESADAEATATPALMNEIDTQSKTVRVEIPKRGRGRSRKIVEKLIIGATKSDAEGQLALARKDARVKLADSMSLAHRTVRNSYQSVSLRVTHDSYELNVRKRADLSAHGSRVTQDTEEYDTQKTSCMRETADPSARRSRVT